jgi:hypothetical protein
MWLPLDKSEKSLRKNFMPFKAKQLKKLIIPSTHWKRKKRLSASILFYILFYFRLVSRYFSLVMFNYWIEYYRLHLINTLFLQKISFYPDYNANLYHLALFNFVKPSFFISAFSSYYFFDLDFSTEKFVLTKGKGKFSGFNFTILKAYQRKYKISLIKKKELSYKWYFIHKKKNYFCWVKYREYTKLYSRWLKNLFNRSRKLLFFKRMVTNWKNNFYFSKISNSPKIKKNRRTNKRIKLQRFIIRTLHAAKIEEIKKLDKLNKWNYFNSRNRNRNRNRNNFRLNSTKY